MENIKKLYRETKELYYFIKPMKLFLNQEGKKYRLKESLEALKIIRDIVEIKKTEYEKKREEFENALNALQSTCSHEVIITDELNTKCALCGNLIIKIPKSTTTQIIVDDNSSPYVSFYNAKENTILYEIYDILETYKDEYEEALENWQEENDIDENKVKVRRIVR